MNNYVHCGTFVTNISDTRLWNELGKISLLSFLV